MDGVPFGENAEPGHDQENTNDPEAHGGSERDFKAQSLRLLEAIEHRDEDAVRNLLEKGANLGAKNRDGQTALHLAVRNRDKPISLLLLKKGADPEIGGGDGSKPLFIAAGLGGLELVDLLLMFNADVESFNLETKRTALHQAVEHSHATVAKLLLEKGANIDVRAPNGYTPLFKAVIGSNLELVELLLQHGANRRLRLENGQAADDLAVGDNTIVDLLRADYLLQGPSTKSLRYLGNYYASIHDTSRGNLNKGFSFWDKGCCDCRHRLADYCSCFRAHHVYPSTSPLFQAFRIDYRQ